MWVKVRMMAGGRESQIDELSKLSTIEELRKRIQEEMEEKDGELEPANQRLFFKGKVRELFVTMNCIWSAACWHFHI